MAEALRRAHLEDGLAWSRMAVLVRSTRTTLAVLRRAMIAAGVPVAVASPDIPLAEQPAVAHLLAALHAVLHPDDLHDEAAEGSAARRRSAVRTRCSCGDCATSCTGWPEPVGSPGDDWLPPRCGTCRARPSWPSTYAGRFNEWRGSWRAGRVVMDAGGSAEDCALGAMGREPVGLALGCGQSQWRFDRGGS